METELIIVFIILLILFIIYLFIKKTDVCSIIHRTDEKEEFNVGAEFKNWKPWQKGAAGLGAVATAAALAKGSYILADEHIFNSENYKI